MQVVRQSFACLHGWIKTIECMGWENDERGLDGREEPKRENLC
jgi:hypothetical protein